jgi:PQQ-like domain
MTAKLPTALSRLVAIATTGRVLLLGGLDATNQTTGTISAFDPTTATVTPFGTLALPVHDAAGGLLTGSAALVGGGAATSIDAVQTVAPNSAHAVVTGHLPQPRSDDAVAVGDGTLYVAGGYTGTTELPEVLATNDAITFRTVANLPQTVRYAAATVVGNSLWILGGEHHGVAIDDIQRVDLATGQATVAGHLPHPLAHAAAVYLNGSLLLIGGTDGQNHQNTIYTIDTATATATVAGSLPIATSDMGVAVSGDSAYVFGGEALTAEQTISTTPTIERIRFQTVAAQASHTTAAGAVPFDGKLLIADRGNNRLLLVDANGTIDWTFPNAQAPAPASGFYFPDDAFFVNHGKSIISNQEGNNTIVEISYPDGKSLWSYGTPGQAGFKPGFLHEPDDAYRLKDGRVIVADANNCRILIISAQAQPIGQIGTTGNCTHHPPTSLGYPNGDTPLQNGNVLISETTGSWISEYTFASKLVWTVHLPLAYPSDPQQIGPDKYIVADYATPGGIVEFDREGHILWDYHVPSGRNMLDHPSLAEVLPNGLICVNDDYRHRVAIIDPATKTIVWQYGVDDTSGSAPGLLNTPDGFDLLAPDGTTPTHPFTG